MRKTKKDDKLIQNKATSSSLTSLEQLLSCTDKSSSPVVRITRNEAADAAARALQVQGTKKRVGKSNSNKRPPPPGPKSRTKRVCCLCNAELDKIPSNSWIVTRSNICLLNQFVFTSEFVQHGKQVEQLEDKGLSWICTGCSKTINRIEEFQREMEEIEGKVQEIVQCIRAVYRQNNTNTSHPSPDIKKPRSIQISNSFSTIGDEVVIEMENVKTELPEMEDGHEFFSHEIEPETMDSNSCADDPEGDPEKDNTCMMSVPLESANNTSSTRPSRRSKVRANEFLHSVTYKDEQEQEFSAAPFKQKSDISDELDDGNLEATDDSGEENFSNVGTAGQPARKFSRGRPQVCEECEDKFPTMKLLWSHITEVHKRDPSECVMCDKKYTTQRAYILHYRRVHQNLRNFKCKEPGCDKEYFGRYEYKLHRERHRRGAVRIKENNDSAEARPGSSSSADAGTTTLDSITSESEHNSNNGFTCECCGKIFKNKASFTRHHEEAHGPHKNRHICYICGKGFALERTLKNHMYYHAAMANPKKCDVCGGSFPTLQQLNEHIDSVHKGYRPYKCQICFKGFGRKRVLAQHKLTHKALKCSECSETFTEVRLLKIHERRVHPSNRTYQCEHCPQSYSEQGRLTAHTRKLHTGETPKFSCNKCHKSFTTWRSRLRHAKISKCGSDGLEKFTCQKCPQMFLSLRTLSRHYGIAHVDDNSEVVSNIQSCQASALGDAIRPNTESEIPIISEPEIEISS